MEVGSEMRILIKNGYIATVDEIRRVYQNGFILIEDTKILKIGDMSEYGGERVDKEIDAKGCIVTPGLINMHNHHWGSLVRGTGDGLLLEPWLDEVTIPLMKVMDNDILRISSYLCAIEQIRTGTTMSLNHMVTTTDEDGYKSIAEPVAEVGIRQYITKEVRNTPDKPFSTKYAIESRHPRDLDEELGMAEAIINKWNGANDGLIYSGLALETGANWMLHNASTDVLIDKGHQLAKRKNVRITNHCAAGTRWLSIKDFKESTGGGDVDYLERLGVLDETWVLIHNIWLTEREIAAVARTGANTVTCPVSNAYSADGIAPVKRMLEHGLKVALGTDGSYVNNSVDMVEQMKFASLIQNVTHLNPTIISSETALEMATINGAIALGLDHEIGSLEVGKRADISIFNLRKAYITPVHKPITSLVFSAHGTDVDTVIVNGKILLENGQLKSFSREEELLNEVQSVANRFVEKAGITHRCKTHWPTIGESVHFCCK
jgi:5-methylthioadenosine/S-adenosylhomocysteine deaminase